MVEIYSLSRFVTRNLLCYVSIEENWFPKRMRFLIG